MKLSFRLVIPALAGIVAVSALHSAGDVDFTREVLPIFAESCYGCHGPKVQMGGLRLDIPPKPGVVLAGNSAGSLLIQRVTAADPQKRMPLGGGPLRADQIEILRKWIAS